MPTGRCRPLVTFLLQREAATPLAQVVEILPWTPDLAVSQPGGTLVGIALSRGRSIPVLCLASLLGQAPPTRSASSSILVVETGAALTGFLVRALQGIEQARWEPRMPLAAPAADDALSAALQSGEHVLVGTGAGQRTLSLLDLHRIAKALRPPQARELAAPLPQPASLDCMA